MSWCLVTRPEVQSDVDEGAEYYDEREPDTGLGAEFAREIWRTIDRLLTNPLLYRVRDARLHVRWVIPPRFPYRIVYVIKDESVIVLGVIHASKRDRAWKQRAR